MLPVLLIPKFKVPDVKVVPPLYVFAPDNVMLLLPTFVKAMPEPLIIPPNVPVPLPPIELFVASVIALLITSLAPEKVNAPALPTPVPFKLIVAALLANVPLAKLISNAAPEATDMADELFVPFPKPLAFCTLNVPAVTLVAPVYWFTPDKINVPPLAFSVSAPLPLIFPPKLVVAPFVTLNVLPLFNVPLLLKVILLLPPIVPVSLAPTVKLLFNNVAAVVAKTVPPFNVKAPVPNAAVVEPLPALPASSVPLFNVVVPE